MHKLQQIKYAIATTFKIETRPLTDFGLAELFNFNISDDFSLKKLFNLTLCRFYNLYL